MAIQRTGGKKTATKTASTKAAKPATGKAKANGAKAARLADEQAKAGKAAAPKRTRRTAEDVRKLVPAFRSHLQGGGKMKELKAEHGFSDDGPIRQALYLEGFDSKGNELPADAHAEIKGTDKAIGPKLAKLRAEGVPLYALAYRTGKSEAEVKALIEAAGGPTGRVYRQSEPKPKQAAKKAAGKAKAAASKATGKKSSTKRAKKADEDPS